MRSALIFRSYQSRDSGQDNLLTKLGWSDGDPQLGNSSVSPLEGGVCVNKFTTPSNNHNKRQDIKGSRASQDGVDNSSLAHESDLTIDKISSRDYKPDFPGFSGDWAVGAMKVPPLRRLIPSYVKSIKSSLDALFGPSGSETCLKINNTKESLPCCGCIPMDYMYSYADIPPYDGCDCCSHQ